MIVQISMVRDELPLLKIMLPIWKKFADGFVFMVDTTTDGTIEYLEKVKDIYNILDILIVNKTDSKLWIETDDRQLLFDTALRYTNKIICLDADEYLDGQLNKNDLEHILEINTDTVFYLNWIQYTNKNTIRVDGPWKNNHKDRIGTYSRNFKFIPTQMHSTHLPIPTNQLYIGSDKLFISHLQWLNKNFVAIKQYYWKVTDYVNNKLFGVNTVGNHAYDASVNNFNWEETHFNYELKINPNVYDEMLNDDNYRIIYINEMTKKHNIPNLGDWGFKIINEN